MSGYCDFWDSHKCEEPKMTETLTMSTKERQRLQVVSRIHRRDTTVAAAAESLQISEWQMYRLLIFSAQARHRPPHDFGQYTGAALLTNGLKIKLSTGLNPNVSHGTIHRWTTGIHQCRRGMRFPRSLVSEFKKRVSGFCHPTKSQIDIDWLVDREVDRRKVTPSYSMATARLGYCPPPVDGSILLSVLLNQDHK